MSEGIFYMNDEIDELLRKRRKEHSFLLRIGVALSVVGAARSMKEEDLVLVVPAF